MCPFPQLRSKMVIGWAPMRFYRMNTVKEAVTRNRRRLPARLESVRINDAIRCDSYGSRPGTGAGLEGLHRTSNAWLQIDSCHLLAREIPFIRKRIATAQSGTFYLADTEPSAYRFSPGNMLRLGRFGSRDQYRAGTGTRPVHGHRGMLKAPFG